MFGDKFIIVQFLLNTKFNKVKMTCAKFLGVNFSFKTGKRKMSQNLSDYRSVHSTYNDATKFVYKELLSSDVTFNLSTFEVGCDH